MWKNPIVLFFLAVGLVLAFLPSYQQMQDLKAVNHAYEAEIERLKVDKEQLLEERRLLEEDPVYLEKVAREKMGLIREGEVVYRIERVGQPAAE